MYVCGVFVLLSNVLVVGNAITSFVCWLAGTAWLKYS